MSTQSPEEAARHLLEIFARDHDTLRAGQVLSRGVAKTQFLEDHRWHIQDFVAGLQYAVKHNWIKIPSPNVIRLTEDGISCSLLH